MAVVALPNCHWAEGSMVDLEVIGAACHRRGIPLVCDLTQSAGQGGCSEQALDRS